MHILFFSHYFSPEVNAPASRTHEHCREWVRKGARCTVITCFPNHPDGRLFPGYRNRLFQVETIDGIRVVRVWTYLAANKGIIRRSLNYLCYMFTAAAAALFVGRADVFVATSPQFFCGLAGFIVSFLKKAPFILEIRDLWPDSIVAVGALKRGVAIRFVEFLERLMYSRARHIVSVGEGYKLELIKRGVPAQKVTVIPNGIDFESFNLRPGALPSSIGCIAGGGPFLVSYIGTVGMAHGLDVILRAARRLKDEADLSIRFVIAGDGAERSHLEQLARNEALDNVLFLGRLPREDVPALLTASGAALVHLKKKQLFETVLPSKLFEPWAMKKPVILGVRGSAESVLQEAKGGLIIEPENEVELVDAARQLQLNPDESRAMAEQGYAYVRSHFDRKKNAQIYLDLLRDFSKGG